MLIRFQFGNFRSFRDVQTLSWVAGRLRHPSRPAVPSHGFEFGLLPVCAIYGANASGKSNVLEALKFFSRAIRDSFRWAPDQKIRRTQFLGTAADPDNPTSFVLDFKVDDVDYQFGFEVNDVAVVKEWLWAFPQGRKQEWYRRALGESMHFGPNLRGSNRVIEGRTRANSLFLSAAVQFRQEQLQPIYIALTRKLKVKANAFADRLPAVARYIEEKSRKEQVIRLLRAADLGVSDLRIAERRVGFSPSDSMEIKEADRPEFTIKTIRLTHRIGDTYVEFAEDQESEGTRILLGQMPSVLTALESGGFLAIDEIDRSLHPILCISLISLFMRKETNPKSAQLLFTTHDSTLLSSGDLRRDEIWFTEKKADGASDLYPLSDYSPRRDENLERGYLQGRYGAIPFLNREQFLEAVENDSNEEEA